VASAGTLLGGLSLSVAGDAGGGGGGGGEEEEEAAGGGLGWLHSSIVVGTVAFLHGVVGLAVLQMVAMSQMQGCRRWLQAARRRRQLQVRNEAVDAEMPAADREKVPHRAHHLRRISLHRVHYISQ
jgi:hypothetical protein